MPGWWDKLTGKAPRADGESSDEPSKSPEQPQSSATPAPVHLAADENPFGVPILDLRPVTLSMISTSDPELVALFGR